ncbi:MAG TPA: class I SAM-dependent methyltransferase [Acidimicrobiales bacterium]|nr:class I SAM-dependent methyltransferase [Acidimicrobiales bacterium]
MAGAGGLHYDDWVAEFYDSWFADWFDRAGTVDRLVELAGGGPVLELGIGTGRVALPLVQRGVEVHGVDASEAMVARLRAKPGGEHVPVTIGDFSEVAVPGRFSLVFVTAGSFFELQRQEAQVRGFANVARCLRPGGLFVLDGPVPDTGRHGDEAAMRVVRGRSGQLVVRFAEVDRAEQRYVSHYAVLGEGGPRVFSVPYRYALPAELDLMAAMAGLRLRERTAGWRGERFTSASDQHVSVYELPAQGAD